MYTIWSRTATKIKRCGPPHLDIPKSILSNLISDGFKISYIAKLLGVTERTIYRRMQQFNLYVENFSDISDDVLFLEVGKTVKEFPFCDENMVMQLLKQRGFRVQRWRLRDALHCKKSVLCYLIYSVNNFKKRCFRSKWCKLSWTLHI